jgi:hypothetical protein
MASCGISSRRKRKETVEGEGSESKTLREGKRRRGVAAEHRGWIVDGGRGRGRRKTLAEPGKDGAATQREDGESMNEKVPIQRREERRAGLLYFVVVRVLRCYLALYPPSPRAAY